MKDSFTKGLGFFATALIPFAQSNILTIFKKFIIKYLNNYNKVNNCIENLPFFLYIASAEIFAHFKML